MPGHHKFTGTVAPATTPAYVGDHYTDTVLKVGYISVGTASSADWKDVTTPASALSDGDYGDVVVSSSGTVISFDSSVVTTAAKTVLDDATVGAMVDTLFGAASSGTGGAARLDTPTFTGTVTAPGFQLASGAIWGTHLVLNSGQWLTWDGGNLQLHFVTNDHLGQYNGTNAQFHSIANTWTSSTNNEFLEAGWASNLAHLWTTKGSGGGTARELLLGYDSTEKMRIGSAVVGFSVAPKLPSYTVAGVPSAATAGAGAMIYVSNEAGGAVVAFSDATDWRRVTDRAIIS